MHWFIRKRFLFLPQTVAGWLIVALACTCAVGSFIKIDRASHSASDTLINWCANLIIIGVAYSVIGWLTSKKNSR